jgi:hypothetical protein
MHNKELNKTKTLVNLTVDQMEALKKMSEESLVPVAALVRLAVERFINQGGINGLLRNVARGRK